MKKSGSKREMDLILSDVIDKPKGEPRRKLKQIL